MSLSVRILAVMACAVLSLTATVSAKDGNTAVSHGSKEEDEIVARAKGLFDSHQEEAAIKVLQDGEKQINPSPAYYRMLGHYLGMREHREEAIAALETSLKYEKVPDVYMIVASHHHQLHEFDEAVQVMKEGAKHFTPDAKYYEHWSNLCGAAGQREQAIVALNHVLKLKPDKAHLYYVRGTWLLKQGKREQALADFQQAIKYGESSIDAVMAIGDVYFGQGKLKEAEQAYRQCNEKDPKLVRAYLQLFKVCLASGGDDQTAMRLFKTCMEKASPMAEECMEFTGPCARRKRPELGVLVVRETSKKFPKHSSIRRWEIHQLIKHKNVRQAWLDLREQLQVLPFDRDAAGLLTTCYYTLHDCDTISPYNDSMLHEMPNSWPAVHACLECARVKDKKNDLGKSFLVLEKLIPEMTNVDEVAGIRAWCWKRHYYEPDLQALNRLMELRKDKLPASELLSMKLEICQCLLYLRRTSECIKETTGLLAAVERTANPLERARVCLVLAEAYANDGKKEQATSYLNLALLQKRNFSTDEQAAVTRIKRNVM